MQCATKILTLLISLLSAGNSVIAGVTRVENHCGFTIWCASAKNDGTASATRALSGGSSATFQNIYNDNIGVSLKTTFSGSKFPNKFARTVKGGIAWYDLSAIDGDPFLAQRRVGYWANTNCQIVCNPGDTTSCEFPYMPTCPDPTDMVLTFC
ncbi:uncharacterized protein PG986_009428 [Apiospora aurea]|uniref:Uncharacterized protein n=1 Tax=Apiospora aurea TaxID=335848 RepID=A0ABR1Q7L4_9PEZI